MAAPCMWKKRPTRPAGWSASVSGMATAGASAASRSAIDLTNRVISNAYHPQSPAVASAGFFFLSGCAHRTQHRLARPAIDLQPGGFLVRPQRGAGLHPGLAVQLVLVEADARQMTLHGFDRGRAQLRRGGPWRCERLWVDDAVAEMADEQHIQIRKIVFLDDKIVLRGQEGWAVDAFWLQQ